MKTKYVKVGGIKSYVFNRGRKCVDLWVPNITKEREVTIVVPTYVSFDIGISTCIECIAGNDSCFLYATVFLF